MNLVNGLARHGSLPVWKPHFFFVLRSGSDEPFSGPCVYVTGLIDNYCSSGHLLPMQTTARTCRHRYRRDRIFIGSKPVVIAIEKTSRICSLTIFFSGQKKKHKHVIFPLPVFGILKFFYSSWRIESSFSRGIFNRL